MPSQQLLLSWKDHNGALVSVFENLLKSKTLVDCTLAAEGQYLKAHKVVLSACSSYFELLFSQESEKNPIVILKDVKFQELEAAVNFMYRGEVEVCEDRLAAFLEVADSLQIKGLGSDGKSQDTRGKTPPVKSTKTSVAPRQHSRKEVANTQSENTGESTNTLDSDQNSNNSSSHHLRSRRETSGSSPIPSTLAIASSYSIQSASTSCPVRPEAQRDRDNLEDNRCSSPGVSRFPPGETVPSDVNTVIKTEPVTDAYLDEKSDETERDFDDVTMMEDQEDWDDPNPESMGEEHAAGQQEHGFSTDEMKTEDIASDNAAGGPAEQPSSESVWIEGGDGQQFAGVFVKEDPIPSWGQPQQDQLGAGGADAGAARGGSEDSASERPPSTQRPWPYRRPSSSGNPALLRCAVCSEAFCNPWSLARHRRSHPGMTPHQCPQCDYATLHSQALIAHLRTHTGERPFGCAECGERFTVKSNLNRHVRRFHSARN